MKKQFSKFVCSSLLATALVSGVTVSKAHAAAEPFLGEVMWFAGNFCPRGWASADGQLMAISQNSALFSLLGTMYGGDGRTTFGLPDLRGRVAVNAGQGPGLSNYRQGQQVGQESTNEVPAHAHSLGNGVIATLKANGSTATLENNVASPSGNMLANGQRAAIYGPQSTAPDDTVTLHSSSVSVTGSTQLTGTTYVDIRQPTLALKACIALQGVFPSRS
ncbi:phage tail protein [Thalassolituus maritimus]|uniref:Tail fiber protein n=1 Tax=Thalassolituus maritimus TaxID=484498 RepID=A0ABQ0A140_9GAMM